MSQAITVRDRKELKKLDTALIKEQAEEFLTRFIVPKEITDPVERRAAAMMLARLKHTLGLDPMLGHVTIASFSGSDYRIIIQYTGYTVLAHNAARKEGTQIYIKPAEQMSEMEISQHGGLICQTCSGKGKRKFKDKEYDCKSCEGRGRFEPGEVVGMKCKLYVYSDAKMMADIGMENEYEPVVGMGIWQPGHALPKTKSPLWKAEVNALKDAIRHRLSNVYMEAMGAGLDILDSSDSGFAVLSNHDFERAKKEIIDSAKVIGLNIPIATLDDLVEFLLDATSSDYFETVADALYALQSVSEASKFNQGSAPNLKWKMVGYASGIWPVNFLEGPSELSHVEAKLVDIMVKEKSSGEHDLPSLHANIFGSDSSTGAYYRIRCGNLMSYLDGGMDKEQVVYFSDKNSLAGGDIIDVEVEVDS